MLHKLGKRELEVDAMANDDRDILELLKDELDFIDKGGYGRSFVSPEHQAAEVPCHYIPLNEAGETIEDLEVEDNQARLERELGDWLRTRINEIEEERAKQVTAGCQ